MVDHKFVNIGICPEHGAIGLKPDRIHNKCPYCSKFARPSIFSFEACTH